MDLADYERKAWLIKMSFSCFVCAHYCFAGWYNIHASLRRNNNA